MDDDGKATPFAGLLLRVLLQSGAGFVLWAGPVFVSAGTVRWPRGWLHIATWAVALTVNFVILVKTNPEVLQQRTKRARFSGGLDTLFMLLMLPMVLAIPVVAGLDAVRFQWTSLPAWVILPGLLLHIVGDVLVLWSMAVNPYLEKSVRIQTERGHRVVTTGPYRYVRHPMYAGVILMLAGLPLVIGSCWTFAPVAATALLLATRTLYEERTLRDGLPGYVAYAERTRSRLIPGIW